MRSFKKHKKATTEKYLRVTMPDGTQWDVPADIIARSRAVYYEQQEKDPEEAKRIYNEEYSFTLKDNYELTNWAAGNMNWSDVVAYATMVKDANLPDYQEGWLNGEQQVIVRKITAEYDADEK